MPTLKVNSWLGRRKFTVNSRVPARPGWTLARAARRPRPHARCHHRAPFSLLFASLRRPASPSATYKRLPPLSLVRIAPLPSPQASAGTIGAAASKLAPSLSLGPFGAQAVTCCPTFLLTSPEFDSSGCTATSSPRRSPTTSATDPPPPIDEW
jgi:hypothetical protein